MLPFGLLWNMANMLLWRDALWRMLMITCFAALGCRTATPVACSALADGVVDHCDAEQQRDWSAAYLPPPGASGSRITDLSYAIAPGALMFEEQRGLPDDINQPYQRRARGDICNQSWLRLPSAHTGTHLDAPSHFSDDAFTDGRGVESLNLHILNGPALLVQVPDETNITAAALEALSIPEGIVRILFKTRNSKRRLMEQRSFSTDYVSLTADGAQWLVVHRPSVQLLGIDYLTVATYDDLKTPHEILLGKGIIAVEGLKLHELDAGLHQLYCLPVKLQGSDGAPVRCIAIS